LNSIVAQDFLPKKEVFAEKEAVTLGICSISKPAFESRVARWYIFKPKIPIWVNFVVSFSEKCW
jgi:hypothetical protein